MKTILYLLAFIWGAALLYRGLTEGLPGPPMKAKDWGTVAGFGFGVLLVLVGLHHFWQRLSDNDAALAGGSVLIAVVVAAAVTAGAVAWRGKSRAASRECDAVLAHLHALVVSPDPSPENRARFEQARPLFMRSCMQMTSEQRKCPMSATTIEQVKLCP